ncbi:MAG: hypothetical protein NTY02_10100 [Acidobacteria bacterium]|nr:hypothetical protein [Acidobacteriota bacterium]
MLTHGQEIELADLPAVVRGRYAEVLEPSLVEGDSLRAWGSRYARLVLHRCGYNKRQACRVLGISYHTLQADLRVGPSVPDDATEREGDRQWPAPAMASVPVRRGRVAPSVEVVTIGA